MPKLRTLLPLALALGLGCAMASVGFAQQNQAPPPGNTTSGSDITGAAGTSMDPQLDRAQAYQRKLQIEDRRKRMLADAERLATLSEQVRAAVQAMGPGATSTEVAAKSAEIARLVRELGNLNKE